MKSARAILAAFIGGVMAVVFVLARRSSKETGKSIPAALTDVPGEAQRLAADVRSRATGAVSTGWGTVREKEAAIKERIVGGGNADSGEGVEASEEAEGAEAVETGEGTEPPDVAEEA
jgi:hypothetical protein